jgi:hypothetical protein
MATGDLGRCVCVFGGGAKRNPLFILYIHIHAYVCMYVCVCVYMVRGCYYYYDSI